jgi:hypothetical protein
MKYGIYQEVRRLPKPGEYGRPQPKRVKVIEAETAYDAAVAFCNAQPRGWRERIIEVSSISRRTAQVWMRRYTPSGRYKGETHWHVWPIV